MRRCAITGAAGYVGSAIATAFAKRGWKVTGLGRRRNPAVAEHLDFDLAIDPAQIRWDGVDALVHAGYDFSLLDWPKIQEVNVAGSLRLLRRARAAGVCRGVFISSLSAYPGCRSLYGKAKLEIESAALELGYSVVRPGLVYGGESGGMIAALERAAASSPVVPLIGDGSHPQYLAHCEDLGDLVATLCQADVPPVVRAISAAHPEGIPFRTLLQRLAQRHGRHPLFVPVPWPLLHAGLKTLEMLRLPAPFRSDSLIGFVFQNPAPDFRLPELPQCIFRSFA